MDLAFCVCASDFCFAVAFIIDMFHVLGSAMISLHAALTCMYLSLAYAKMSGILRLPVTVLRVFLKLVTEWRAAWISSTVMRL